MNGAVYASLAILCLLFVSSIKGSVQVVKADSGTIYIRTDGSIDPPIAPISTSDNVTYTLTDNITSDGIVIERDNIVLDGAGYTVQGIGGLYWPVGVGVSLTGRTNDTVENINVNGFGNGIELHLCYVGNNSIVGNNITNNGHGIHCETVYSDNRISGNNITNNGEGIFFEHASNNSISGNNIKANEWDGIYLRSSQNNTIVKNNIADNRWGINTEWENFDPIHTLGNRIYNNNFVNNSVQASIEPEPNVWDDGYPSGGNYWSDYNGTDTNHDGIGNTKDYVMDAYRYNVDRYPLMGMFSDFNATSEYHVQTICNSTISDFQFNGTAIMFNVTGVEGTTGFCRICVPTSLMNATYRVFVNGTEVSCNLLPCSNSTHSYLYFTYTHSIQHVIITIPEFPSFLILPLFFMATLPAVIAYRRKHASPLNRVQSMVTSDY